MYGRGYVNNGDLIAATYIRNEFIKYKLKPMARGHYQWFTMNANTFPDTLRVKINKKELTPGKDYLIGAKSESRNAKQKIMLCNKQTIHSSDFSRIPEKDFCRKFILIDTVGFTQEDYELLNKKRSACTTNAVAYIEKQKLTHKISREISGCTFHILSASLPDNPKNISYAFKNKYLSNYQTQNIAGYIEGTLRPDSFIVFSAHYDHLGMMGKDVYFPGANDNASGIAMLLNLARHYQENPPKFSVAFIAFGAEEAGLVGSKYYVEHPLFPLSQIKFLINMDILGTGDEGIKVVNATEHTKEFDELVKINSEKEYLPSVQPRGKAANSDHFPFSEKGVKTFFIYTLGGIKAYHDIYDRPETLPLTKFEEVFHLLTSFTDYLQE